MGELLGLEHLFDVPTPRDGEDVKNPLRPASSAAQRDRPPAHGPHAQPDGDGHPDPLAPHARRHAPSDPRHRPRRHRHADDGRAPARRRRQNQPRGDWAARRSPSASGLEAAIRQRHHRPDAPPRRQRRLVARILHHGRPAVAQSRKPSFVCGSRASSIAERTS